MGYIYEGLSRIDLDEVVEVSKDESIVIYSHCLVATIIIQGYSYILRAVVEYRKIYTSEVMIFLYIPNDPSTIYYSLSIPKEDISLITNWSKHCNQPNYLYLTAISQVVAFILCILQIPLYNINWKTKALY